jgi:histidyl-tRNA synthetase
MKHKKTSNKKSKTEKFLQTLRGMHDVLPSEQPWWERIEKVARELASFYNFGKIDTPILEHADLFQRSVGEETDLIQKEMYLLKTKGGDVLALRPENTAGIARAYLEHNLGRIAQPQKLYYQGPFFRHENPQSGRFRQFNQIGFEILGGVNDPVYDAQVIIIFQRLLENLKIKNINLKINSIGCKICRPTYKRQLQIYYKTHEKKICSDCENRIKTNPLRLLDCKKEQCQEFKSKAPNFFDKLCSNCSRQLKGTLEYLDEVGVPYNLDNQLVRGLDYYNQTVFEFSVIGPGSEVGALPGGGRYDYLTEMLGARVTPAVGGACGIERLIAVMKAQEIKVAQKVAKRVFFIHVGELAKKKSLKIIEILREADIPVQEALSKESLKAQLKLANKEGMELALIFGQKEIFEENVILRDLTHRLQETIPLNRIAEEIKKRWKR